jgi:hypothetical protein
MKTYNKYKFSLFGLALVVLSFILSPVESKAQSFISFDVFYNELAPYGSWVHNPQYGQVWIPNVRRDFHPYVTRGQWVMTDYGNTWVSDYSWGWAPFHYGRWYIDDYYGWAWVPGYDWGPAWVAWRSGDGHYGWAPLSPGLNVNVSINIGHLIPRRHWRYVPHRYISHARIYDYCVPPRRATHFYNRTTIINNTYVYNNQHHYYSGPQVREIERVTRQRVAVRQVRPAQRPGTPALRKGSVTMYQPAARGGRQGQATRVHNNSGVANQNSFDNRSSYRRSSRTSTNVSPAAPRPRSPRVDYSSSNRSSTVQNRGSRDASPRSSQNYSSKKSSTTTTGNQYGSSRTQRSTVKSSANRSSTRSSNSGVNQRSTVNQSSARTSSGTKRTVTPSRSNTSRSGVSRSTTSRNSTQTNVSRSSSSNSRSAVSRSSKSRTSGARSTTSRSNRSRPN